MEKVLLLPQFGGVFFDDWKSLLMKGNSLLMITYNVMSKPSLSNSTVIVLCRNLSCFLFIKNVFSYFSHFLNGSNYQKVNIFFSYINYMMVQSGLWSQHNSCFFFFFFLLDCLGIRDCLMKRQTQFINAKLIISKSKKDGLWSMIVHRIFCFLFITNIPFCWKLLKPVQHNIESKWSIFNRLMAKSSNK